MKPIPTICRTCLATVFPKLIAGRWRLLESNGEEHICNDSQLAASGSASQLAASGSASQLAASGNDSIVSCAAAGCTVSGGLRGALSAGWWDGTRWRIAVAYVGEDGIKENTPYRLDAKGAWVEVVKDEVTA